MKVLTFNPYDWNTITLKKNEGVKAIPTASMMKTDKTYNVVGKFLGIDMIHEWNKYYDRVFEITEWAKKKSKSTELTDIIKTITDRVNEIPAMASKRIDDLYISIQIESDEKPKEKTETKSEKVSEKAEEVK